MPPSWVSARPFIGKRSSNNLIPYKPNSSNYSSPSNCCYWVYTSINKNPAVTSRIKSLYKVYLSSTLSGLAINRFNKILDRYFVLDNKDKSYFFCTQSAQKAQSFIPFGVSRWRWRGRKLRYDKRAQSSLCEVRLSMDSTD